MIIGFCRAPDQVEVSLVVNGALAIELGPGMSSFMVQEVKDQNGRAIGIVVLQNGVTVWRSQTDLPPSE